MTLLVFTGGVVPEYQSKSFGLTSWRILLSKFFNHQLQGLSLRQGAFCGSNEKQESNGAPGSKFWHDFWPQVWNGAVFLGKWLPIAFILEYLIAGYVFQVVMR